MLLPFSYASSGEGYLAGREANITIPARINNDIDIYPSPLHHIYIRNILTEEEAAKCCQLSKEFAEQTGRWTEPDFDRHASYATVDFPVDECAILENYLRDVDFDNRIFQQFGALYGIDPADMDYIDLFVAHYEAKDSKDPDQNKKVMDHLELHRDGSLLSFSLLLNSPDEFNGGGTFYDALQEVQPEGVLYQGGIIRPLKEGDACLHCGKILHGADVVTSGSRTVLVGFVDVTDRYFRPGALALACTDFGRMDVASFRYRRQREQENQGIVLTNSKWIQGKSHISGSVPAFASAVRRAQPEFQRKRKLEAEDLLLRQILLPPDERPEDVFGGDISILEGFEI